MILDQESANKLRRMMDTCHQVYVETNPHRASYQSIESYMKSDPDMAADFCGDVAEGQTLYVLQVYPDTPVGFFRACGHDLAALVNVVASLVDSNG